MSFDVVAQRFTGQAAEGITCNPCGIQFAIPTSLHTAWVQKERSVTCPSCKSSLVPAFKTDAEKLRDELTRERARLDQVRADNDRLYERVASRDRQIRARKAVATRLRNRIKKGKCPCCSHEFKDLQAHMKTKHPKWNPEKAVAALASK